MIVNFDNNYSTLLGKIKFHFELEDALRTVHIRLARGRTTLETYRELSGWAGDVESQLRGECDAK